MTDIVVVGDRFAEFSENDNVFTFSQALKFLSAAKYEDNYQIIFGQGLSKENIEEIKNSLCRDTDKKLLLNHSPLLWEKTRITHKHKKKNVLISKTIKTGDISYQCHLLIDDDCAEMTVRYFRPGLRGDFTAECIINVIQNSTLCLFVTIKFSAVDKENLSLIEQQMATKSLSHLYLIS
ncbi:hypothetical protein [Xenorhabdus sp. Sc-CR9]|uniref:hypothetical protein n=1 Tax=Xenorhabdus sp. Sc-CR9 TaxID=2584468 RepID=UPI001F34116F|nr:hypothetical protein [Xenorhabdus sp. Sc-CR9]